MNDGLAASMAQLAAEIAEQPTLQATLDAICTHAVQDLAADGCGIFLRRGRRIEVAAVAGPGVAGAERAQMETGQGPCLETVWQSESYVVPDLRTDTRWPRWAARMVTMGWRSALSLRLVESERTIGSLNLFSRTTHAFADADVNRALLFSRHASLALAASRSRATLGEAVDARHLIGMAQGILMQRYGVGIEQSFAILRRHSQQANVKLHLVAAQVLENRALPETVDAPGRYPPPAA